MKILFKIFLSAVLAFVHLFVPKAALLFFLCACYFLIQLFQLFEY